MFNFSKTTLSVSQIWNDSFQLYKSRFIKVFFLAFISYAIPVFLTTVLHFKSLFFIYFAHKIISSLTMIFFVALIMHYLYNSALNPASKIKDSIGPVFKKYLNVFFVWLFAAVFLFGLFALCFLLVDGLSILEQMKNMTADSYLLLAALLMFKIIRAFFIWLAFAIFFAGILITVIPSILFENKNCFSTIGRSIKLVWGNWWRTFFAAVLPLILIFLVVIAIAAMIVFPSLSLVKSPQAAQLAYWLGALIGALLSALSLPLTVSVILVQFNDLKLRRNNSLKQN